jgi:D-alanyl-D-alanine carboxypeptidase
MREEMCGKHRKRPAAESADEDDSTPSAGNQSDPNSPMAFMLSSLAPTGNIKPSQLIGPPGPVNPIVVYTGPAKKSADAQVAAVRAKLDKKSQKQVASADSSSGVAAASTEASGQSASATNNTISVPPPGAFGPPPGRFTPPSRRGMPSVGDNPAVMSFTSPARAGPAPLTAMPDAAPQTVSVPLPRPRPKLKKKSAAR